MTKIKLFVVLLVFGLAGIAFASNPIQDKHTNHDKTAVCCSAGAACCDGGSCCANKEHTACATTKDGKSKADAKAEDKAEDCCKPGAACCNGGSCCEKKAETNKADSKPAKQAKQANHKDGCCAGGSCYAKHKSHG